MVESEALLTKEMLSDVLPLTNGANVIMKGTLCPAAIVSGREIPLTLNWELLDVTAESVTLEPVAVRLAFWLPVDPM